MNKITTLVFDLDGTLYCGASAVDGALDAIDSLINLKYNVFYFTNNSSKTRPQIVDKLNKLGFQAKPQNTYCASYALVKYLLQKKIKNIYLIGTDDLKAELLAQNIEIMNSSQVSAVVIGLDSSFNYSKISIALEAINNGAQLIALNIDSFYPVENNKRLPGCGTMVGAVASAASHAPDFIIGKPNTYMIELLCQEHNLSPKEICIVGDSLKSDIEMANNFKCQSILFDPANEFPTFSGKKIQQHKEIISWLS